MFGGRQRERAAIEQSHAGLGAGDLRNLAALFYQDRKKETSRPRHAVMPYAITLHCFGSTIFLDVILSGYARCLSN